MRWRPVVLLGVPILLVAAAFGHARWQMHAAREGLLEPHAIAWRIAGEPAALRMRREMDQDLERISIEVRVGGATRSRIEFEIDHDLFGGGFAGGLDVDEDGEHELVLATRSGRRASLLIEPGPEGLLERSFEELPDPLWQAIEPRLERIAPGMMHMLLLLAAFVWLAAALLVYAIIGALALVRRLRRAA